MMTFVECVKVISPPKCPREICLGMMSVILSLFTRMSMLMVAHANLLEKQPMLFALMGHPLSITETPVSKTIVKCFYLV